MKRLLGTILLAGGLAHGQVPQIPNQSSTNPLTAERTKTRLKFEQNNPPTISKDKGPTDKDVAEALKQLKSSKRADGNMNSGGGNALMGKLIQDYRKEITEFKAYHSGVKTILKSLSTRLPVLAKTIEKRMAELSFYVLPIKLVPLAEEYTGLPFQSEQPAIQKTFESYEQGAEVFISEKDFGSMPAERQARLLLHETVESIFLTNSQDQRAGEMKKVRDVTHVIFNSDKYSEDELRSLIVKANAQTSYGFGKIKTEVCGGINWYWQEGKDFTEFCSSGRYAGYYNFKTDYGTNLFLTSTSITKMQTEISEIIKEKLRVEEEANEKQANLLKRREKRTAELKIEFDKIKDQYAVIANSFFSQYSNLCQTANYRGTFDPENREMVSSPEATTQNIKKFYRELYNFEREAAVVLFKANYASKPYFTQRGVDARLLQGPFYYGMLQMLVAELGNPSEYKLTLEGWQGEVRESIHYFLKTRGGESPSYYRNIGLPINYQIESLSVNIQTEKGLTLVNDQMQKMSVNACKTENQENVRKALINKISGNFDFVAQFYPFYENDLRYSAD